MKGRELIFCILCWDYALATSLHEYYQSNIAPAAGLLDRKLSEGAASSLLQYPELKFEPNIDGLIRYSKYNQNTFDKYTAKLKTLIDAYAKERQVTTNVVECGSYSGYRPSDQWDKACRVDLTFDIGIDSARCQETNDFGFSDGEACILLSLDRVYNWVPEPYTNETVPNAIRDVWTEEKITLTCEPGPDPVSIDNIVAIDVLPADGIPVKFFPYFGQSSWLSPLVSVNVISIPGIVVQVKCTAWAKNIKHRNLLNTGSVTFDLLVD